MEKAGESEIKEILEEFPDFLSQMVGWLLKHSKNEKQKTNDQLQGCRLGINKRLVFKFG